MREGGVRRIWPVCDAKERETATRAQKAREPACIARERECYRLMKSFAEVRAGGRHRRGDRAHPDLGLRRQQQLYRRAFDAAEVAIFTIHSFPARTVV